MYGSQDSVVQAYGESRRNLHVFFDIGLVLSCEIVAGLVLSAAQYMFSTPLERACTKLQDGWGAVQLAEGKDAKGLESMDHSFSQVLGPPFSGPGNSSLLSLQRCG